MVSVQISNLSHPTVERAKSFASKILDGMTHDERYISGSMIQHHHRLTVDQAAAGARQHIPVLVFSYDDQILVIFLYACISIGQGYINSHQSTVSKDGIRSIEHEQ
jgi:hypothetical protein